MRYKLSGFNHYFSFGGDEIGIFNTYSGAVIGLSPNEYVELKNGDGNIDALVKQGILVPYHKNELDELYVNRAKRMLANEEPTYRIFTTTDCNARCFYCYEDRTAKTYMSPETAEQTADFILGSLGDRRCLIQWFGGEPLMNPTAIDIISDRLKDRTRFMMISNASLVDEIGVDRIKTWGITKIQVTLDGTEDVYERRKAYVDGSSLNRVLQNIKTLIDHDIFVTVRINYEHRNLDDVIELIHILAETFLDRKNLGVYAAHLFSDKKGDDTETRKRDWFSIQTKLIEVGFSNSQKSYGLNYRISQCFACHTRSFVITPDGGLYKCALATGNPKERFGSVYDGVTDYSILMSWADPSIREECRACEWLPICQCGCEAGRKGYISDKCILQKDFVDEILRLRYRRLKP